MLSGQRHVASTQRSVERASTSKTADRWIQTKTSILIGFKYLIDDLMSACLRMLRVDHSTPRAPEQADAAFLVDLAQTLPRVYFKKKHLKGAEKQRPSLETDPLRFAEKVHRLWNGLVDVETLLRQPELSHSHTLI